MIATGGAYLVNPLVERLTRRGLSRTSATALLLGGAGVTSTSALFVVVPLLLEQAKRVPEYIDRAQQTLVPLVERVAQQRLPHTLAELTELAGSHAQEIAAQVLPKAGSMVGGAWGVVSAIVGGSLSALSFVLGAFVIPVVGFYVLRDWPGIVSGCQSLVPARHLPTVRRRMDEIDLKLSSFVRGQLTMAAVLSALYSIVLSVIGLKLAVVVGLVTGIGNLVPYVGVGTGMLLASVFCVVDFGFDYHLVLVLGAFATLLAADGVFITPRIVGDKVGLSPAAVIVSVMACGAVFGFAGVLFAVPCAAVAKGVAGISVEAWKQSRTYRAG